MIEPIPAMAKFVDLVPTFERLCADPSWRVRYMCADKFQELQTTFSKTTPETELANVFKSFLADTENEVRAAAATRLEKVAKNFSKQTIIDVIIPELAKMKSDESQAVRGTSEWDFPAILFSFSLSNFVYKFFPSSSCALNLPFL